MSGQQMNRVCVWELATSVALRVSEFFQFCPPSLSCPARKGGKKTPSHPFESLSFTTQIIIYIVLETVYLVKLTFGFFKCAIKTKSRHLELWN